MKAKIKNCRLKFGAFGIWIAMLICLSLNAQAPAIEWQKSFGGSNADSANDVFQTADGGYIFTGASGSNNGDVSGNHGSDDVWVGKLSSSGNLEWQRSLGGPGLDWSRNIQQTQDGGYIISARSNANGGDVTGNHGEHDFWIIKLSSAGTLLWQKSLGGSNRDDPQYVLETSDGGYMITGFTSSIDGDVTANDISANVWVVKIDSFGVIQWQKTYGGSDNDIAYCIQPTLDGGYIISGESDSIDGDLTNNQGGLDVWVFKIDASGNLLWQKSYGGSNNEAGQSIKQTSDGGYIVAGWTVSNDGDVSGNNGLVDCWLVKISGTGNLEWQRTFGGSDNDSLQEVQIVPNGSYIIAGASDSNNGDVSGNHGLFDYWTALVSSSGNIVWQRALGGSESDFGRSIKITSDGGYVVVGGSSSNDGDVTGNHGLSDTWIVKLAPDPLEVSEFNKNEIAFYPNPVIDRLHIETSENIEKIIVFNLQGQKLFENSPNSVKTEINMESFSEGIYLIQIMANRKSDTFKILKQ